MTAPLRSTPVTPLHPAPFHFPVYAKYFIKSPIIQIMVGKNKKNTESACFPVANDLYDKLASVAAAVSKGELTALEGSRKFLDYTVDVASKHGPDSSQSSLLRTNMDKLIANVAADRSSRVPLVLDAFAMFARILAEKQAMVGTGAMLNLILNTACRYINSPNVEMRQNCALLISKILNSIPDQTSEILDEALEPIFTNLMDHCDDKEAKVRMICIEALKRLQVPTDPECDVCEKLRYAIANDPSPSVRKIAMQTVAITKKAFAVVFTKIRDASDAVRREATVILAKKVDPKSFPPEKKVELLRTVFVDRSESVVAAAKNYIVPAWLGAYENNIFALLRTFNLNDGNHVEATKTLLDAIGDCDSTDEAVFGPVAQLLKEKTSDGANPTPEETPPAADEVTCQTSLQTEPQVLILPRSILTPEIAFYWLYIVRKYSHDLPDLKGGSFIHPTLTQFLDYLEEHIKELASVEEKNKKSFVLTTSFLIQLLKPYLQARDEFGRKKMLSLLPYFAAYPMSEAEIATQKLLDLIPDIFYHRIQAESLQPEMSQTEYEKAMEDDRQLRLRHCQLIVRVNQLRNEMEENVAAQEFLRANQLKAECEDAEAELAEVKDEMEKQGKRLDVSEFDADLLERRKSRVPAGASEVKDTDTTAAILKFAKRVLSEAYPHSLRMEDVDSSQRLSLIPQIQSIDDKYALDGICIPVPEIRRDAFICFGLISFRSAEIARKKIPLLLQPAKLDTLDVRLSCLTIIGELLVYYGSEHLGRFACCSAENQALLGKGVVHLIKALFPFSLEGTIDICKITKSLFEFCSEFSLFRAPDFMTHAVHRELARLLMEWAMKALLDSDQNEFASHLLWSLSLLDVAPEFQELFELRDSLFALIPNDDNVNVKAVHRFFKRVEEKGGSYERAAYEFRRKRLPDLNMDAPGLVSVDQKLESEITEPRPESELQLETVFSNGGDPSAALSDMTGLSSASSVTVPKKGEFYGKYREYVERHRSRTRGRNRLLIQLGILESEAFEDSSDDPDDDDFVPSTTIPHFSSTDTAGFVNAVTLKMCDFLNSFGATCQEQLDQIDSRIQTTDTLLRGIEAKLASLPELGDPSQAEETVTNTIPEQIVVEASSQNSTMKSTGENEVTSEPSTPSAPPPAPVDPHLAKFFKMVAVGIPPPAVKQKMKAEGYDPDLLDGPPPQLRPVSSGTAVSDSSSSSDSEGS
ncbi:unnamed protein product [Cyprideis torosa]|uniref:Uncharacterized protein n=1 Tax=Cyprideis torosa TaxID=163714 RepID=A0A7R8WIP1_9CRUS|nr:unnamed protein product [Cyprideis torosa]CAG0898165.1 unnamed protein product [Cyprideis torosa]